MLIYNKVDINFKGDRIPLPLTFAAEQGDMNYVELLIGAGADLNGGAFCEFLCNDGTPLILAADGYGDVKIIELLLENGAKVDAMGSSSSEVPYKSALMPATWRNRIETVTLLLKYGANPLLRNEYGSAMETAKKEGHREIIALFEVNIREREAKLKVNIAEMSGRQKRALKKLEKNGLTYDAESFLAIVKSGNIKRYDYF